MDALQKLGRFVIGGRSAIEDPTLALREAYGDACERAHLLERDADLAPQGYGQQGLSDMASSAREQTDLIRTFLREHGVGLLPTPPAPIATSSMNHWGRLVEALKRHQSSSRRLREQAIEFADSHPKVAEFFTRLGKQDARACERLRALIARADPQALD